jgi:hypothetical protein
MFPTKGELVSFKFAVTFEVSNDATIILFESGVISIVEAFSIGQEKLNLS